MSRYRKCALMVLGAAAVTATVQPVYAQTRSYVVNWFTLATYSEDGDCSKGLNTPIEVVFYQSMLQNGLSEEKAKKLVSFLNGGTPDPELRFAVENRGRIGGQPVNVYLNPTSVPDPQLGEVDGPHGLGFNLDGKGPQDGKPGYKDPYTGETGIDNNYVRALGCFNSHRAKPPVRPTHHAYMWDGIRPSLPAWIVTIEGDDLSKNGDVTVKFEQSLEVAPVDANANARRNYTFRIDPDPRSRNTFKGRLNNNIVTIDPGPLYMKGEPYLTTAFDFVDTHMKLQLKPDGTLDGLVGGYLPWMQLYYTYGQGGSAQEASIGFNIPGIFYALRRLADAYPDPATGENTRISAAYQIEAVPAFAVWPGEYAGTSSAPSRDHRASAE
jgi:hypothetical protein